MQISTIFNLHQPLCPHSVLQYYTTSKLIISSRRKVAMTGIEYKVYALTSLMCTAKQRGQTLIYTQLYFMDHICQSNIMSFISCQIRQKYAESMCTNGGSMHLYRKCTCTNFTNSFMMSELCQIIPASDTTEASLN